jgi:hypothetical protein
MDRARFLSGARCAAIVIFAVSPAAARAECSTASTGARCVVAGSGLRGASEVGRRVLARTRTPAYSPGDVLPPGRYLRLLNSEYYGLPPVDGDWRYYDVEGRVLRVHPDTLEVIGDATHETNRAY